MTSSRKHHVLTLFPLAPEPQGNVLLNPLATALDQDDQHNYRKDAGNYTNKSYAVHIFSPFLVNEVFVKTLHYGDGRRTQSYQKEGGKNKQHKREDKFDRCLRCLLLHSLATLGSEGVRMNAQGFGDARSKFFRLNKYGDQIAYTIDVGAVSKMPPCIGARTSGPLLEHHDC